MPYRVLPSAVLADTLVYHAVMLLAILRYRLRPHAVNFPVNFSGNLSVNLLLSRCECLYEAVCEFAFVRLFPNMLHWVSTFSFAMFFVVFLYVLLMTPTFRVATFNDGVVLAVVPSIVDDNYHSATPTRGPIDSKWD